MRSLPRLAPWLLAALPALTAGVARADSGADDGCLKLVEPFGPANYPRGGHEVAFQAPTVAGARWFVSVERIGASPGEVVLNGQKIVNKRQLAGPANAFVRVEVALAATNVLRVEVPGKTTLRVTVQGLVPADAPVPGRRVARLTLFEQPFLAGRHSTQVPVPSAEGLFELSVRQGSTPALLGTLLWNGAPVLGAAPIRPGRGGGAALAPVLARTTNRVDALVLGGAPSSIVVRLEGWVVDEVAPTAAWTAPAPGAVVFRDEDAFALELSDDLSGVESLRVELNGEDATAAFVVDLAAGRARATFGALRALLRPGANTLSAVVRDRACNETVAALGFLADLLPPAIEPPADLTVEQTSPAGTVTTFETPRATDDTDAAPIVMCEPASGSLFAAGATVVTCTATDASGKTSQATFTVTVVDTTPPALERPADVVVEQTAPEGNVVTFATPTATDVADPAPVVVCAPASGSLFPRGATAVVCTATDAAGNSAQVAFTVTVQDTVAPDLALEPTEGAVLQSADVVLRASWADAGSGVDPQTFRALLDGEDVTALFARTDEGATATLRLASATHAFDASVRDVAGNERAARATFRVEAEVRVDRLELTVGPPARGPAPDETPLLTLAPEARPLDGSGNDAAAPDEGKAGARLLRDALAPAYADGASAPAGPTRRSAREVSNAVSAQATSVLNARGATDYLWFWAQFVDHDLSLTRAHVPHEPLPIPVGPTDAFDPLWTGAVQLPFNRSRYDPASSPREQTNEQTAWLDGSAIYGADPARAAALRANDGTGRLLTSPGDLLPRNTGGLDNLPTRHDPSLFLAGDVRANQTLPLLALHTIFVREHNRLAGLLRARFPDATDEALYQGARRIVTAELQAITYQEFVPALLGRGALAPYGGYAPDRRVGIENAFAHAAFRAGHSLLSPVLLRLDAQGAPIAEGPLALRDAFFAPARLTDGGGLEPLLRGAARQLAQAPDPLVVDDVRNYLFGQPGQGGLDLVALDVQRGRDHGLPGYNEARRQLGLAPRASLAEVTSDPAVQARLASVYATVEDVDLVTGALCEDAVPGTLVGEVAFVLLKRQLELLRDGDRFFYEHAFSGAALEALRATRLADVIRRNTTVGGELPDDVFRGPLLPFTENDFSVRAVAEDGETVTTFAGVVQVAVSDGRPPLDGFVFELTAADQGRVTFLGLAFFQTLGELTITARTVPLGQGDPEGDTEVAGAVGVSVVLAAPTVFPALPPVVAVGEELTLQGLSFVGQQVELVVDGQLVATEVAGPTGAYTLSVRLAPGAHEVLVRAVDPATGALVVSRSFAVEQQAPPPGGLEANPAALSLAVGQAQPVAILERFVDETTKDVTTLAAYSTSDPAVVAVSPAGVVTAVGVGSATVTAAFDGFTVEVPVTVGVPILAATSPVHAETGVAVTRETVLRFSAPVQAATVTPDSIKAEFAGASLPGTLHVSPDRRTVTLFYAQALPVSARVRVTVAGDLLRDDLGNAIDADRDGQPGGTARIDFDTLTITVVPGTAAFGRVFSSRLAHEYEVGEDAYVEPAPMDPNQPGAPYDPARVVSLNVPLGGARISVVGAEETLFTFTDETGSFRLDPAPAGTFFVHVEVVDPERRLNYPDVGKPWTTIAGEETGVGDIYLPIVDDDVMQPVSDTEATTVGFTDEMTAAFPHLAGTQLTVPAGSLYSTSGTTEEKRVGIAPVPPDRLPAPLPEGLSFSVVFTVQTTGGENFDVPAAVRFPNTEGLPPGAKSALWSFNHDTGEWEVIGPMTVSADGLWVETDPGVGILAPGWNGQQSGTQGQDQPPGEGQRNLKEVLDALNQETNGSPGSTSTDCNVFFHNGEEYFDRVDLAIPGRGDVHFAMSRRYRSRIVYDGPLGHGWDFTYDEHLRIEANGDVTRVNGQSHVDRWVRLAGGRFLAPTGFFGALTQREDGTYALREPNGFERHYSSDGWLLRHVDRYGNTMLFEHDEFGDLDFVVDAYGREIDFTFQTFASGKRRLTSVRDFAGREVVYAYDARGDLVAVRSPIVVGTSNGNDFPAGRTERYTYSFGFDEPRLNHNILTLTFPEEVAVNGPPTLVWTYGEDVADELTFDKVVARIRGGTNASGVPTGGLQVFEYSLLNEEVPLGDLRVARHRTRLIERNGNITEHDFNERDLEIVQRVYSRGLRPDEPEVYETRSEYDQDGQLLRRVHPAGDEVHFAYDRSGPRSAARNLVEVRRKAGPRGHDGQGAPAEDLVTTFTYEPLYNRVLTVTDARGNSSSYTPPLGERSAGRYTTRFFYDYQESGPDVPVPQAVALGIDLTSVARGLGDLNGDGRIDQTFGNVVRTEAPSVLLAEDSSEAARLGSTTQRVVSETRWNDRGQVIASVDAEGNLTTFEHHPENDPDGDGLPVFSFMRVLSPTDATGHLKRVTVDASADPVVAPRRTSSSPAAALTTSYRYDAVGNVIAVTNPRGVETQLEVTALNQVVVTTRGADVTQAIASQQLAPGEAALRYKARAFYDFNGRVVKTEVENRDSTTQDVGAYVERTVTYDLLGLVVASTVEVDAATTLTTTFRYDGSENLIEVTLPEGNKVATTYDGRDLPFTITRGAGTSDASTITLDYDPNGNPLRVTDAEDTDGDGQREQSLFTYDGFDRLVEARDALGNRAVTAYDVASQVIQTQAFGHPAGAPASPHVLLADRRFSHDELGRVFRTDAGLFLSSGFTTVRPVALTDHDGDGFVTARIDHDALSRVTSVVEDDLERTFTRYDGVSRPVERVDTLGNRVLTTYDKRSNPVAVTALEVSPDGLVPTETFTTRYVYDQLDRLVRATDSAGQTSRFAYDSRDQLVLRSDPEGPLTADPLALFPGAINGPGNTTSFVHDGLGRMIRQVTDLRVGGTGAGALDTSNPNNRDGQIALGYVFDKNSRLVGIVDDNGNRTSFGYDALDRRVSQTNADSESYAFSYDKDGNVRTVTDPSGSVITKTYDALNRLVELTVARGAGVFGTTRETYAYDGLSRLVQATDDNGNAALSNQVTQYVYDSLGRTLEERQNGAAVSSVYTGDGKRAQVTYPGGRVITRTFDALDRIKQLREGSTALASTEWIGPGLRELRRLNGNGTRLTFLNDAGNADVGYDAVQRLVRLRVLAAGGGAIVDREYAYNRASQRTLERRHDDAGLTDRYVYDSAYRVVASSYDQDGLTGAIPRELRSVSYVMDGVGNRRSVTKGTALGEATEAYAVNAVNEYTSVAGVARTNDDNGNLTDDGRRLFFYDYKNRLVAVSDKVTGTPIAAYEYLPDGRRSKKSVWSGGAWQETRFFYDGAQEVEEVGPAGTTTYVWSPVYVDELVTYTNALGTFYTHQDARCDVVAITDSSGAVVERVRFDDFGRAEIRGPGGEVRASSAVGCAYGFQGRRLDAETGLLYFRARYYDPETGRFLQRDPVWDARNVGGQYTFVGNGPISGRDPSGRNGKKGVRNLGDLWDRIGKKGPKPNMGDTPPQGGPQHEGWIRRLVEDAQARRADDIRSGQKQVDADGNYSGSNQPDFQALVGSRREIVEVDTTSDGGLKHVSDVVLNDPAARSRFVFIDKDSGEVTAVVDYYPPEGGKPASWAVHDAHGTQSSTDPDMRAFPPPPGDRGLYGIAAWLAAPNAIDASTREGATEADVWIAGSWDVAGTLDPVNATGAVDRALDRWQGTVTPRKGLEGFLERKFRGLFDPAGLEAAVDDFFDIWELLGDLSRPTPGCAPGAGQ